MVAGEFAAERDVPLVGPEAALADELGEGGEARGVVEPVDDDPLLFGGGEAGGEREAQGEQHAGHEDDEQREESGAHGGTAGGLRGGATRR